MKKVINETPPTDVVTVKDVSITKFYGIVCCGTKGFITRAGFEGKYTICISDRVTIQDGWASFDNENFANLVKHILGNSSFTIYEFDTAKELYKWLSE